MATLVPIGIAAELVNVPVGTLKKYRARGYIVADDETDGGHSRWHVPRLVEQLKAVPDGRKNNRPPGRRKKVPA